MAKELFKFSDCYRGNASPKELAIISKCASRVGLSMGDVSHV